MVMSLNLDYILNIIKSPKFLSAFPDVTSEHISDIERQFKYVSSGTFRALFNVESVSPGLVNKNFELSLEESWGVELSKSQNNFITSPNNIRLCNSKFLISNKAQVGSVPCVELDLNLNFKGYVGKLGDDLSIGEYQDPVDASFSVKNNLYYVVSQSDNIVHRYDGKTKQFVGSIGTGVAGAAGTPNTTTSLLTEPIAIGLGSSYIYVLCAQGTPSGATGEGFVAVYDYEHKFKCIALYSGLNGGSGSCYEGEIKEPKDLIVTQQNGRDLLYILNGDNSIGVFDTNLLVSENKLNSIGVINLPSKLGVVNGSLKRIAIDGNVLYTTAKDIGKVIAVNTDGELIGTFGKLADESGLGSDSTLGFFNGVSGICVYSDKIITTEYINGRVQVFGKTLLTQNDFEIIMQPVYMPNNQVVLDICTSLAGDIISDVKILDLNFNNAEISIETAIKKKISAFKIKIYIDPMRFSSKKSVIKMEPFYILMEDYI